VKLYFSHLTGERYFIQSREEHSKAILKSPKAEMILLDGNKIKFFNDPKHTMELTINDASGEIIAVSPDRKDLLIGNYGKKVVIVGVSSPALLSNYPFWAAAVQLSSDYYILPNGKIFENCRSVKAWIKKYGKDKLEFNRRSFEEAAKLANPTSKGIIKVVKKPKSKSDDPFFDPKVLKSKEKVSESTLIKRKNSILAKRGVKDDILVCDNCRFMKNCPQFQAGAVCSYSKRFKELAPLVKTRDLDLLTGSLQKIMEMESERYMRGATLEQLTGDVDPGVTHLGETLFRKVKDFIEIMRPVLNNETTYNILNVNVNTAVGMERLENAGLTEDQRRDLAGEIEGIIKEQRRKTAP
jgi:hypothetical protein